MSALGIFLISGYIGFYFAQNYEQSCLYFQKITHSSPKLVLQKPEVPVDKQQDLVASGVNGGQLPAVLQTAAIAETPAAPVASTEETGQPAKADPLDGIVKHAPSGEVGANSTGSERSTVAPAKEARDAPRS